MEFKFSDLLLDSMDIKQLEELSYQISYWKNEELESHVASFLPQVLSSLDNQQTQKKALMVIQQVKKRFSMSKVRIALCFFP